jgi:hypothetical protein
VYSLFALLQRATADDIQLRKQKYQKSFLCDNNRNMTAARPFCIAGAVAVVVG